MTTASTDDLRTVSLRGFPIDVFLESRQHSEALLREFAIIADGGGDNAELPRRLLEILGRVRARARGLNTGLAREFEGAVERGATTVDFDLVVPLRMATGAWEFARMLDEVDEYCRTGALLTLETPPQVRSLRRWYLSEMTRQVEGAAPTPWSEWHDSEPPTRS